MKGVEFIMICKFADFIVDLRNIPPELQKYFSGFEVNSQPEVFFEITEQDIDYEINLLNGGCTKTNAVLIAYLRKFALWAITNNAFLLHASLIDVNGTGVAFCAPSGTGKTTHTLLWQNLLGDDMAIVNGDKPIIRIFENEEFPIGYGTAWNGKEGLGNRSSVPIKHICFIERAEINSCEKVEPSAVLELFFKQIFIPRRDKVLVSKTLKLLDLFLKNVTVWKIRCNTDIDAARVAYNTIFKEKQNET